MNKHRHLTLLGGGEIEIGAGMGEALGRQLPGPGAEEDGEEALARALALVTRIRDEERRAATLEKLAPRLSGSLWDRAWSILGTVTGDRAWLRAAAALMIQLPSRHRYAAAEQILTRIGDLSDEYQRARELVSLAPHLPAVHRRRAIDAATDAAGLIENVFLCADSVDSLVPLLSGEAFDEVLTMVADIGDEPRRSKLLVKLAAPIPGRLVDRAVAVAEDLDDDCCRIRALAALAQRLPAPRRHTLLYQTLTAAAATDGSDRAQLLATLAPSLPTDLHGRALAAACDIGDEFYRDCALAGLAPHLSADLLEEALTAVLAITGERGRNLALPALVPRLPGHLLDRALSAVSELIDEGDRGRLLTGLVAHLPTALIDRAFATASAITTARPRAWALRALAQRLPTDRLGQVLTLADGLTDTLECGELLAALAPRLPEELLGRGLTVACAITDDTGRDQALAALAPRLPAELVDSALAAARPLVETMFGSDALGALLPRLSEAKQREIRLVELNAAISSFAEVDAEWGSSILPAVIADLPGDLVDHALTAVRAMTDPGDRATGLSIVAARLPLEPLNMILTEACDVADRQVRDWLLAELIPHLPAAAARGGGRSSSGA